MYLSSDHFLELSESKIDTTIVQNLFAEGCSSVRLKSVNTHETSANHVRATQILPKQVYHLAYLPGWQLW